MCAEDIVRGYCDDIMSGKIASGRYIKLAVERFLGDIDGDDYYVDWKEVENIYNLGKCLHHYEGSFAGKPFILSPWQLWVSACIFGVKKRSDDCRRYRTAYIKIGKKNGKSLWCVLMLLYGILSDPNSPQGYFVANSREQARICFNMLCHLCSQLDPKGKDIKQLRSEVRIKPNDGFIKILSTDNKTVDGINCAFGICDEVENYATNDIYENLVSSQASRNEGTILLIGTAGFDKNSWDYEQLLQSKRVLDGIVEDNTLFSAIYQMDETDDWEDETNWIKCNPNMGESVNYDFLRDRAQTAKSSDSQYVGVLTKNFNWYLDAPEVWISDDVFRRQSFDFDWEDFKQNRRKYIVTIGVDLSSVSDFSSISILFANQSENKYYFYNKYYLPEQALVDSPNKEKYKDWRRRGFLTVTSGNVIDIEYIVSDCVKAFKDFQVLTLAYDPAFAVQFIVNCTNEGLNCEEYRQNLMNFTKPVLEYERMLKDGVCYIDNNPINRFCASNVQLKSDWNGNVKPIKDGSDKTRKIDGVVAQLEALGKYLEYIGW